MATIDRFEDVEEWQKARELTREVYRATRQPSFSRDFEIRDQIRAASVSTMSTIAEGFERDGDAEFRQCLSIAKGSVGEVRSCLYAALDAEHIDHETHERLTALAVETSRLLAGFIRYLNSSDYKGKKFR